MALFQTAVIDPDKLDGQPTGNLIATDRITDNSQEKYFQIVKLATGDLESFGGVVLARNPFPVVDPRVAFAESVILDEYGDTAKVMDSGQQVFKFGRNASIGTTTRATIMTLPSGTNNETYVAVGGGNPIDQVSSSNASDTQTVKVFGHTQAGSPPVFTQVTQSFALTGQTPVTLGTPLARVERLYNDDSSDLQGDVYVWESGGGSTSGVPDVDADVHLVVEAGRNQSQKTALTVASTDYLLITEIRTDILEKTTNLFIDVDLEIRRAGKVFRQQVNLAATPGNAAVTKFDPFLIVPPNSDVRMSALASALNTDVSSSIQGYIALIQT